MKESMTNKYGLTRSQQTKLIEVIKQYLPSSEIILYGSRAKGNFNKRSDIDIVIAGSNTNDPYILSQIEEGIIESDIPYICDIQYVATIKNQSLLDHIKRRGQRIDV